MTIENKSAAFAARDFVCMRTGSGVIVKTGRRLPRRGGRVHASKGASEREVQGWGVLNLKYEIRWITCEKLPCSLTANAVDARQSGRLRPARLGQEALRRRRR